MKMKKTFLRLVFATVLTVVAFSSTPRDSSAATLCASCQEPNYDCMACCRCLGGSFWTCYWNCA